MKLVKPILAVTAITAFGTILLYGLLGNTQNTKENQEQNQPEQQSQTQTSSSHNTSKTSASNLNKSSQSETKQTILKQPYQRSTSVPRTPGILEGLEQFPPGALERYDYKLGFNQRLETCLGKNIPEKG